MNTMKSPLGGTQITRRAATAGLGPRNRWDSESATINAQFHAKPIPARKRLTKFESLTAKLAKLKSKGSDSLPSALVFAKAKRSARNAAKRTPKKLKNP